MVVEEALASSHSVVDILGSFYFAASGPGDGVADTFSTRAFDLMLNWRTYSRRMVLF